MFLLFLMLAPLVEGVCLNGYIISSELTCSQKKEIVAVHNKLRDLVASGKGINLPPAQDMLEMVWSDVAANTAQILADLCLFEHNTTIGGIHVGQNLALIKSTGITDFEGSLESMMNGWIDEGKMYVAGKFETSTGHYSQMIWGSSSFVGCGYTVYKDKDSDYRLLVCNYLPPGNFLGEQPYTYGDVDCQRHGKFKSSEYSHLCAMSPITPKVCD